jgi:RNase H-fold protein (predicted Holliday junction resolvase)
MIVLGVDPGRLKCGLAVVNEACAVQYNQVVSTEVVVSAISQLQQQFEIDLIVLGDQTTSREWQHRLSLELQPTPEIVRVDERNSTLEAQQRYWEMYPPQGLARLLPRALRPIPRPIDDVVAILLVERYLKGDRTTKHALE